ncbi:MAG: hypothetical protein ACW98Y_15235 [Candidatus Thorarchaeota archaeon]|jgi:hypothetical protein
MKKTHLALSIIIVLVIGFGLTMYSTPTKTNAIVVPIERSYQEAAIVWSDNFDDGNMDGWVTHEFQGLTPNFTVIDGVVYSQGEDLLNIAGHDSTVVYGTWSFDIYINQPTGVEIMETSPIGNGYSQDGYEVIFLPDSNTIQLDRLYATSETTWDSITLDSYPMDPLGWHHVDVTRDTNGYFCVYLNTTPKLEAIDNTHIISNVFIIGFAGAFDNVAVSNTVDIDLVAPYLLQAPTDQDITYGEEFRYKLNATDNSGVMIWEIADTAQFAISDEGLITNILALEPGDYDVEGTVADDDGYRRTFSFVLTVEVAPLDLTLLIVGGGVASVVVIIVLVIFLKKRS